MTTKMFLDFITHTPGAYTIPEKLNRIQLDVKPATVEALETYLKSRCLKYIQHGYKLIMRHCFEWEYSGVQELELTDENLKTATTVYVVCRKPKQRTEGFRGIKKRAFLKRL